MIMPWDQSRKLRFGIQLQAQRTTGAEYIAAVHAVEEMGYDTLWNFDHMLPFAGPDDQPCFETLTTLTAMATATSRIRVGTLVNGVLYRDPATLAKSAAQVDQLSGGRLEFSLGAAWAEREFRAYGLPFPPVGERMDRLEEALAIVQSLWTQERTTYEGRYYSIRNAPCSPKPVQQPHPPVLIGGNGNRTLKIAARYADEWNGQGSPAVCAERIAVLRANCEAIGRDPSSMICSVHPALAIGRTHEEAEEKARRFAQALDLDLEANRYRALIGTPAEIRSQIQAFVDVGITHWIMGVGAPFDLDGLRLFSEEVAAAFR
jgi:F420-dependent oxidoreductase-like protein